MTEDLGVGVVLLAAGILAVSVAAAVLVLLVRALGRGDSDRHAGRLTGRFLGLVLVAYDAGRYRHAFGPGSTHLRLGGPDDPAGG